MGKLWPISATTLALHRHWLWLAALSSGQQRSQLRPRGQLFMRLALQRFFMVAVKVSTQSCTEAQHVLEPERLRTQFGVSVEYRKSVSLRPARGEGFGAHFQAPCPSFLP